MATLTVGVGQTYATLSAAVNASRDGDVINVQAGTYVNDFAMINKDITIKGVGGMANFVATVAPPNGKGIFVTQGDITVENLSFSGAAVSDMNGAGIRYESGNLVIIDSYFHHNQDGLLANYDANGTIRIVGSEFAYNGAGDGYSHNLYVNGIASLVIEDSYFHDASIGHQIKSRAQSTTIINSRIYDGTGTGSYDIDLPNGGVAVIRGNVIQQGPNSDNAGIIHYGGESAAYAGSSLLIQDNVIVNDKSGSALMLSNATTVVGTLSGNQVYGLTSSQITNASEKLTGIAYLSAHPTLDTSAPWDGTENPGTGNPGTGNPGTDNPGTGNPGTLLGTAGPDKLVGTTGADKMTGLAGDDVYTVNHTGDVVVEVNGQGTDTVLSSVTYKLPDYVENLTLTGSANIDGTGNALANVLTGNSGNNTLDGGAGADKMAGGLGNDTYKVDNVGDVVTEANGQGTDTVLSSVNYKLTEYVENLTLTGSGHITGTGNALANVLTGNSGNNTLDGGAGADRMSGGAGDDTYRVDNVGDVVTEAAGGGTDLVLTSVDYALSNPNVERLAASTVKGTASIDLTGNALNNTVYGNNGDNVIDGGAGSDTLKGYGGADSFVFRDALGPSNIDTISGFRVSDDTIILENAIFSAITGTGTLTEAQFVANTSGVATDSSDRIIYETDTGKLYYDSNGSAAGGATQFALLNKGLALTHSDFFII